MRARVAIAGAAAVAALLPHARADDAVLLSPLDVRDGVVSGRRLFLSAADDRPAALWVTDGTPRGTVRLTDALPAPLAATWDGVAFGAHVSDGTRRGTRRVVRPAYDTALDAISLGPVALAVATRPDGVVVPPPLHVLRTAPSLRAAEPLGTAPAANRDTLTVSVAAGFAALSAVDATTEDWTLLRSDGTRAATSSGTPAPGHLAPHASAVAADGVWYVTRHWFAEPGGAREQRLWRFAPVGAASWTQFPDVAPGSLRSTGRRLFFRSGSGGEELWTALSGETYARLLDSAAGVSGAKGFTEVAGRHAFWAFEESTGYALWSTDGTATGTARISDVPAGAAGNPPRNLHRVGDRLVFLVDDGVHGDEPWATDGTAAGTVPLGDLNPGAATSAALVIATWDGRALLAVDDGSGVRGLWVTDGTPAGTRLHATLPGATADTRIRRAWTVGTRWLVATDAPAALWSVPLPPAAPRTTATDRDGDGFPDDVEDALATSALDRVATPLAGAQAAAEPAPLTVTRLRVARGRVDLVATVDAAWPSDDFQPVIVDAGGAVAGFVVPPRARRAAASDGSRVALRRLPDGRTELRATLRAPPPGLPRADDAPGAPSTTVLVYRGTAVHAGKAPLPVRTAR